MTQSTFDPTISFADYDALHAEPEQWQSMIQEIAASHSLDGLEISPIKDGSNLVAFLGPDLVVKLFPLVGRGLVALC